VTAAASTTAPTRRRAELGGFLKVRRARLSPTDVGLPGGMRRRTAGLRREEVALLAGVGVTWYTWLEQGRPINVSAQVLDAVARTLRLDRTERWHLYYLAEATPNRVGVAPTVVPDAVRNLLNGLDPLPAVLVDQRYDVIEANAAHEELFWDWHTLPCVHQNLLWCIASEPAARTKLLNYDQELPYLVARFRANYAHAADLPSWDEDIARLGSISPDFTELWQRHEVAEPQQRERRYLHPEAGALTFAHTELDVATVPGLRILVSTPQDEQTWERLPATRRPNK
jgi:transcriptional regulator with XRE-family HTH domain